MFKHIVGAVLGLYSVVVCAATPEQLFARGSQFSSVKLSPTGEFLSAIMQRDGKDSLVIFNTETLKPTYALAFPANGQVGKYAWVNDERVVLEKQYLLGWSDEPQYYGELFAVNADGSNSKYLVGYQGAESQVGSNIKRSTALEGSAFILDPMADDKRFMLVKVINWGSGAGWEEHGPHVYSVDVYTGKRKKLMTSPVGLADFLTDHDGNVRFVAGTNRKNKVEIYLREDGEWINVQKLDISLAQFKPISFAEDENSIYALGAEDGKTKGVYKLNLKTGEKSQLIHDEKVDPSGYWLNQKTKKLFAVEFDDGYPSYAFVDAEDERSTLLKNLLTTLSGHQVRIVSEDRAGVQFIVAAYNAQNPGDFYLFNSKTNKLRYLGSANDALDPETMASVKPFSFKASDGMELHGYLTLPLGVDPKNLPLVVNPHGGPHYVRDYWQFDAQNQLIASKGVAVLQVNYRGSGGYGLAFQQAGYGQWGARVQQDIIEATQHVIADGTVDKDRICIVGASFGGYSALQAATMAPELFKCAVGFAGVYDLELMFSEGDIKGLGSGLAYLRQVLPKEPAQLHAMSPVYNVDKLKAAILLVHGGEDERAPIEQYQALTKALDAKSYPYKSLVLDNEGHGFYNDEHCAQYYSELLSFLKTQLKFN